MHRFALSVFQEESKLYHVTTNLNRVQKLETLHDEELPSLLDQEDARQLLHITYGYLLNAKDEKCKLLFREDFYNVLLQYEEDYWSLLEKHIEKHLSLVGAEKGE